MEAVLFAAADPIPAGKLSRSLSQLYDRTEIQAGLERLRRRYESEGSGVQLVEVAGGFRLTTKVELYDYVARVLGRKRTLTLSPAALETLSLIAYKQPISKAGIEAVRGVQSDGVLKHLIELDLVRVVGREEGLGRALLYGTTKKFLEHFGLRGLKDLPRPEA